MRKNEVKRSSAMGSASMELRLKTLWIPKWRSC